MILGGFLAILLLVGVGGACLALLLKSELDEAGKLATILIQSQNCVLLVKVFHLPFVKCVPPRIFPCFSNQPVKSLPAFPFHLSRSTAMSGRGECGHLALSNVDWEKEIGRGKNYI